MLVHEALKKVYCVLTKVSQGIAASDKVQLEDMDLCLRVQQVGICSATTVYTSYFECTINNIYLPTRA